MFDLFATFLGEMWLGIPGSESGIYTGTTRFSVEIEDLNPYASVESTDFYCTVASVGPDEAYAEITPN